MKLFLIGIGYLLYWPSVLCFAFTLFRFRLKPLLLHIVFSSLLLTTLSVYVQNSHFLYWLSVSNALGLVFCMWVIFRINLIHSFIIVFLSLLIVIVTEGAVDYVLPFTAVRFVTEDNMYSFLTNVIFVCLCVMFYILILSKCRWGFSFIVRPRSKEKLLEPRYRGNKILSITLLIGFIATFFASFAFFLYPDIVIYLLLIMILVVAILLRTSYRWEMVD
jgi:hypothetical protein